jgi:hypothetical protein
MNFFDGLHNFEETGTILAVHDNEESEDSEASSKKRSFSSPLEKDKGLCVGGEND